MSKASDQAYRILRARIVSGGFTPGEQLKEELLAEMCGVSRTPVRAAIRRLESEMLVRRTSSRRSYVAEWSSGDIDEIYTLRVMLEAHAAERAGMLVTDEIVQAMKRSIEAINKVLAKKANPRAFLEHNREFHGLIMEASQSMRIYPMLVRLLPQHVVDQAVMSYDLSDMRRSIREHRDILRALEARDPALAKALVTSHIRRGYHTYVGQEGSEK